MIRAHIAKLALLLLAAPCLLAAGETLRIALDRPGEREFVVDRAALINPDDKTAIQQTCDRLLTDKATPIVVVTIESTKTYDGVGLPIEPFAMILFNQWGLGHVTVAGQQWNTGIMLVVSKGDRRARIELGAGWGRQNDRIARRIMDEQIIPRFKEGNFSGGILAGVKSLEAMARAFVGPSGVMSQPDAGAGGGPATQMPPRPASAPPTPMQLRGPSEFSLPPAHRSWGQPLLILLVIGLAVLTAVSLVRRGSSGWAWLAWGAVFSAIGYLLYNSLTSSRRGPWSGGGFSGGSFGGGFSGGGGATGSW